MPGKTTRVSTLPLVLTGPVLRRVDPGSTTVFLALKEPRKVTLEVFKGAPTAGNANRVQVGTRDTVQLVGAPNLHVVAVTANGKLESGTTYTYRVTLEGSAGRQDLLDPGVVDKNPRALLYDGGPAQLSFATPPADPAKLRFLHGSCRKPHGEGFDMLPTADAVVADSFTNTDAGPRPHQLILTGDQIYADDVADALLAAAQELTGALGLPAETLPGLPAGTTLPGPGDRQSVSDDIALFSSTEAKSHLFTFAEFVGAYLLAWSPACWPAELPTFAEVHPAEAQKLGKYYEQVLDGTFSPPMFEWMRGAALKRLLAYQEEVKALELYRSGLGAVRRAMANVPTLMIFDDHEITDDWYIHRNWTERTVLPAGGVSLGRRVVQNGLSAYAIFQGWGNTPDRFGPASPGAALLDAVARWRGDENADSKEIARRAGLPTAMSPKGVPTRPDGALTYHYEVTWPKYQLVALDSRTFREFPNGPKDPPALIYGDAAYDAMVTSVGDLGTDAAHVVIAPAPVFGVPLLEDIAQPLVGGVWTILKYRHNGELEVDPEAWSMHQGAFEKLLSRLATVAAPGPDGVRRRRVVLLSGDVHYGFAAAVRWSASAPFDAPAGHGGKTEAAFAQLVASSFKNEIEKTRFLHAHGYEPGLYQLPTKDRAGWANTGGKEMVVGSKVVTGDGFASLMDLRLTGSPATVEEDLTTTLTVPPDWRWKARWIKHSDAPVPPGPAPVTKPTAGQQALKQFLATAPVFGSYRSEWGAGKEVVGQNNLGDVTFLWPSGDAKQVVQTLWWQLPGQSVPSALTRYAVDLAVGAGSAAPSTPEQTGPPVQVPAAPPLKEGDKDKKGSTAAKYGGAAPPDGTPTDLIAQLQRDLMELGFGLVGAPTGVYDRRTRWAVREFQAWARQPRVARDADPQPRPARYVDCLRAYDVPAADRFTSDPTGVADTATRAAVARWKRDRLRCPVVVEGWKVDSSQKPVALWAMDSVPARTAQNLWTHADLPRAYKVPNKPDRLLFFATDLSGRYEVPARHRVTPPGAAADAPYMVELGEYSGYGGAVGTATVGGQKVEIPIRFGGPYVVPERPATWRGTAEMLPEKLLPVAPGAASAPTLATLAADIHAADSDPGDAARARADRARHQLSTYKVVRSVADVEAVGVFDGVNAYDNAYLSMGACHWTVGPVSITVGAGDAVNVKVIPATEEGKEDRHVADPIAPKDDWKVSPGELWGFLSYLKSVEPASFARLCTDWGFDVKDAWGDSDLWDGSLRKYETQPTSGAVVLPAVSGEYDYFRAWPVLYRFLMAARTDEGFQRRQWNFARQRLADILSTPWDAANGAATVKDVTTGTPAVTRPARIGDLFTSEKAVAMIYRLHIIGPAYVCKKGVAGTTVKKALANAKEQLGSAAFNTAPTAWGQTHEDALLRGLCRAVTGAAATTTDAQMEQQAKNTSSWLVKTAFQAKNWPTWNTTPASKNPRGFVLPIWDALPAADQVLRGERGSFLFDDTDLPGGTG